MKHGDTQSTKARTLNFISLFIDLYTGVQVVDWQVKTNGMTNIDSELINITNADAQVTEI